MKFGKHLEARKGSLPAHYADNCVNYTALKELLKIGVYPCSIKLDPQEEPQQPFAQVVKRRLGDLQQIEVDFIERLDAEVDKASSFFEQESVRVAQQKGDSTNVPELSQKLQHILTLEQFAFLNYTAIVKILKKNDRHSGLALSEPYLRRVAQLPLVQATQLKSSKQQVMNELSNLNGAAEMPKSLAPFMARSHSQYEPTPAGSLPPAAVGPNQRILVSLSGPHGTDIIGAVLDCLARHPCEIGDFMLSRLYHNVTFGALVRLGSDNVGLYRDLAEAAQKWDAVLMFDIPDTQVTEPTIRHLEKPKPTDDVLVQLPHSLEEAPYSGRIKYAATILNQNGLNPEFLNLWTKLLLKHKISVEKLARLNNGDTILSCADMKLSVPTGVDMTSLRDELVKLSAPYGTDIALQLDDVFRKNKRLVVFDMDSTLIRQEVIDEIAKYAGTMDQVASITEAAMRGEIDFKESLRRRVALLKGTSVTVLEEVKKSLTFTEGARFLCRALKTLGFKLAVISGGFMPLALYVKAELGLDYAFANQLKVSDDSTFTGETTGPIVDGIRKAELLDDIARTEGISLKQVIAVGDGANDQWMIQKAGLGIAFNAKPRLQEQARAAINQRSLIYVLTLLGYSENDIDQLSKDNLI